MKRPLIKFAKYGGRFDVTGKEVQIKELEEEMAKGGFWDNIDEANQVNIKLVSLKKIVSEIDNTQNKLNEVGEYLAIDNLDDDTYNEVSVELNNIEDQINKLEIKTLLNNELDELSCYLEIHPGAGGTESCDWALMLSKMYIKFCEKNAYKYEIIEEQKGEEAGLKSITILISGLYAYGYLKCEAGVHRLVRISPFDSNSRRHTSFASVTTTPKIEHEVNLDINEKDLKIDVYRSSGAGGQHVNTTDSAVRITHLPTKTVVTCQNERSQLKNKEQAMKILKGKLYKLELENKTKEISQYKDNNESINFGSQVRSYVLEPYTLVKDYRANYETAQVDKVLNGEIMDIIETVLKKEKREE